MQSGVTYAKGFKADGVACTIKKNGNKDLAVIQCETIAKVAGVFTQNVVKGHSLLLTQRNIQDGNAQIVIINSGNANACLAKRGEKDARSFAKMAADAFGCSVQNVLPASTGVIGHPLPLSKIQSGIKNIAPSQDGGLKAAEAIMTTDTIPKQAETKVLIGGKDINIGGMAKGSGMIHPNMATMISVITTDANICSDALQKALKSTCDVSYNRISIDGDTIFTNLQITNEYIYFKRIKICTGISRSSKDSAPVSVVAVCCRFAERRFCNCVCDFVCVFVAFRTVYVNSDKFCCAFSVGCKHLCKSHTNFF